MSVCTKPKESRIFFNVPISQSRLFPQAPWLYCPTDSLRLTLQHPRFQEQGTAVSVINTTSTWRGLRHVYSHCLREDLDPTMQRGYNGKARTRAVLTAKGQDFLQDFLFPKEDRTGYFLKNVKGNWRKATVWFSAKCKLYTEYVRDRHNNLQHFSQWPSPLFLACVFKMTIFDPCPQMFFTTAISPVSSTSLMQLQAGPDVLYLNIFQNHQRLKNK